MLDIYNETSYIAKCLAFFGTVLSTALSTIHTKTVDNKRYQNCRKWGIIIKTKSWKWGSNHG